MRAFCSHLNTVTVRLIGIDCATVENKIGLALGSAVDDEIQIADVRHGSAEQGAAAVLASWLRQGEYSKALLAIDAPLGWPLELSAALSGHRAGETISVDPDTMFRRETDRFVKSELRKTPLDVGADRIARTAHSAVRLLGQLRQDLGVDIPLAWTPDFSGVAAIEVYPAATLLTRQLKSFGYKKRSQSADRTRLIDSLGVRIGNAKNHLQMIENADALDAVICVLAGADFLRGEAMGPKDRVRAEKEGWIWFRSSRSSH